MAQNETARATVYLNGQQAELALNLLAKKAKDLKKDLKEALEAGDSIKYDKLRGELGRVESAQRSVSKASFDVESVLKNINKVTWRDLEKAQKAVILQMKNIERGTEAYAAKEKDLQKITAELNNVRSVMKEKESGWSRLANGASKYFGIVVAGAAAIGGFVIGFNKIVQSFNDFEEWSDNLSAITGLVGKDLDWLTQKAKDLSTGMLDGGIRITSSAQDIVDAFTKMGSARPELLKDKDALAEVTEKALILAAAAKIELDPAIAAVAASMNQFNLDASQSNRIINAIAAGSLEGSSEVADLTESMKNVGTVAAGSNMSLEQTVATLEVLAEKQLKGAEAGTNLRGALLMMKAAGVGYASGQFNLRDALIEVNAQLDKKTTAIEKDALKQEMFGKENITAGSILVENVDKYDQLTEAVTGTNVAIQQAAVNTDNNNSKLAQAKNAVNIIAIELGEKLAPAQTTAVDLFRQSLEVLKVLIEFIIDYKTAIIASAAGIVVYTAAVKIAALQDNLHYGYLVAKSAITTAYQYVVGVLTGRITLATVAQNAWNLAQKLNPIGIVIALLIAAGTALALYSKKLSDAEIAQKALNDINTDAKKSIVEQKVALEELLRTARNETKSKEERYDAIKKLRDINPQYLGGLTLEKINTDEAKKATDDYIESLLKAAKAKAISKKLEDNATERLNVENGVGVEATIMQKAGNIWDGNVFAKGDFAARNAASGEKNKKQRLAELDASDNYLISQQDTRTVAVFSANASDGKNPGGSGNSGETEKEKKAREKAEKAALKQDKKEAKDIKTQHAEELDELKAAYNDRLLIIKTAYLNESQTKEEYEVKMQLAELAYLETQKALLIQQKQDTTDIELQIVEAKIKVQADGQKMINDLAKAGQKELEDSISESIRSVDEMVAALDKLKNEEEKTNEDRKKTYMDVASSIGESFADTLMSQEQDFGQFLRNTIVMALDALEKMLILSIAETFIKDTTKKGFLGIATAAAKIVLLKAAFGTAKALVLGGSKGKQSGGYADSDANDAKPVGIYHANEFIASGPAVRNPTIKPVLDIIDIAQRNGTIRSLNLPALLGQSGKQSGGYASSSSSQSPIQISGSNSKLEAAIDKLNAHLDKGLTANVNKFGHKGIDEAYADITKFNSLTK